MLASLTLEEIRLRYHHSKEEWQRQADSPLARRYIEHSNKILKLINQLKDLMNKGPV